MSSVKSLYDLSLNQIFGSFNKEEFKFLLQVYPSKFIFEILFKILNIHHDTSEFDKRLSNRIGKTIIRAQFIQLYYTDTFEIDKRTPYYLDHHSKNIEKLYYPRAQCSYEIDVCEIFNLDFFFKFVDSEFKTEFFAVFKACVQITNERLPKHLADTWLDKKRLEDYTCATVQNYVDQGLKLGTYLYNAGWCIESALVLSRTHKVIIDIWFYLNHNTLPTQIIECLTILLLAISDSYDFIEAKRVLAFMMKLVECIEASGYSTSCLVHAYVAISHYFYIMMEHKKALIWASKAILGLDVTISEDLKFLVINHAIRICSVTNRTVMGAILINILNSCDKTVFQNVYLNFLVNKAFYYWTSYNKICYTFYNPVDITFRTYGYFNLKTASVLIDYAYAIYVSKHMNVKFDEGLSSILQALFIMRRIGLPKHHMLVINAKRIKALLYEAFSYYSFMEHYRQHENPEVKLKYMLNKSYAIHIKTLNNFKKVNGSNNTLYSAESYVYLGKICQYLSKYKESQVMHLQAIDIKSQILGPETTEVAWSLYFLANVYMCPRQRNWHSKAYDLLVKAIEIYQADGCDEVYQLQACHQRLLQACKKLNRSLQCDEYVAQLWILVIKSEKYFDTLNAAEVEENSSLRTIDLEDLQTMISRFMEAHCL